MAALSFEQQSIVSLDMHVTDSINVKMFIIIKWFKVSNAFNEHLFVHHRSCWPEKVNDSTKFLQGYRHNCVYVTDRHPQIFFRIQ